MKTIVYHAFFLLSFSLLVINSTANAQCVINGQTYFVNLGPDTTLCTGQSMTINASNGLNFDSYIWNNNSTSPTRFITSPGTYSVRANKLGDNQIVNGDFELGNTGFITDYLVGTGGSFGLLSNEGTYAISTSPSNAHNNFSFCQDHTPGPGTQMMVVNGSGNAGARVWCQNVATTPNTDYQFGAWISSALNSGAVAELQFSINNQNLGGVFSTSPSACDWQQFFQTWNSGLNTNAEICIVNQNIGVGGNDFMLDDITFKPICTSFDTIVVGYNSLPVLSLGSDTTICVGQTLVLDAQNPGSTYLWNDGSTNQTHVVTDAGVYSVTVKNQFLCSKTSQITVSLEESKNAGSDSLAVWCETNAPVNLNSLISSQATAGGLWIDAANTLGSNISSNGNLTISGLSGLYNAIYVVEGIYCPNDTSQFSIQINAQPSAVGSTNVHVCNSSGEVINLNQYTVGSTTTRTPFWIEQSATSSDQFDASTGNFDVSLLSNGIYDFYYVLPADTMCVADSVKVSVQVTENPQIAFHSDVVKGCFPLDVQFVNESIANQNATVSWDFGDGSTASSSAVATHQYRGIGCFDVILSVTADNLCTVSDTIVQMICVDPLPVAQFNVSPQQVFSFDPTVNFENRSTLNTQNSWIFGDGDSSSVEHPTHQYEIGVPGSYLVQLKVVSDQGCVDSTTKIIEVKDQLLFYVPNAFTPDGDEHNNLFLPVMTAGFSEDGYEFVIYNRWGELVFETSSILEGWDGTYKGMLAPNGIYIWTLRFKDELSDKKYEFQGHVNIIR